MKTRQNGFVLVVCLIFLLVFMMMGIFMFGSFTKDQVMAGNYREKSRAEDVAQAALNFSESWLSQPGNAFIGGGATWATGATCNNLNTSALTICSNALSSPTSLPWSSQVSFSPTELVVASGKANAYASGTNLYLQYLGQTSTNPPTALYKATAEATGGNANAVTVIQEILEVRATSKDISQ